MIFAFLSALANATSVVFDKIILSRQRVGLNVFLPIGFLFLFGFSLALAPFLGRIDWEIALLPNSLFLLFLMVIIAIAWNVLFFQSLQREKVHNHELLMMTVPFVTILLAAVFYPEELDKRIFLLGLVASASLVFAKSEKSHFIVDQTSYNTLLAVVLMATESIIIRELLYSYTPVALYAVRTLFITAFFMMYYRPRYSQVSIKHWWMMAFSSLFGLILMLSRFYAFSELGIVYTMLITILGPVIVFFASWEILHERIRPRVIVASLVILACVTWATMIAFG